MNEKDVRLGTVNKWAEKLTDGAVKYQTPIWAESDFLDRLAADRPTDYLAVLDDAYSGIIADQRYVKADGNAVYVTTEHLRADGRVRCLLLELRPSRKHKKDVTVQNITILWEFELGCGFTLAKKIVRSRKFK